MKLEPIRFSIIAEGVASPCAARVLGGGDAEADRDPGRGAGIAGRVASAGTAIQEVVAGAAVEGVVAGAADQGVVAGPAVSVSLPSRPLTTLAAPSPVSVSLKARARQILDIDQGVDPAPIVFCAVAMARLTVTPAVASP